ncbi:MAG: histone deacetylase family protein [Pseudomonadota bacterium]
MSSLTVITHNDCSLYRPHASHPERPERLAAALRGIEQIKNIELLEAEIVDAADLARVHDAEYLAQIERAEASVNKTQQTEVLDADTHAAVGSIHAARLAAGAACQAVDIALSRPGRSTFAIVRPPGHHAESNRAMGFCFFNSIAVAAARALKSFDIQRVAICDFDVHHGNGTEQIFVDDHRVLFASSHQHPLYPGTGTPDQPQADNIRNIGLPPGSGSNQFRDAWQHHLIPDIERFQPDLLLISAGFDAHWRDPLAQLDLKDEDFYWIGHQLHKVAQKHCKGRLVASLEGGYDLQALTESTLAFGEGITIG